ncbi:zinc finger protein 830 [Chironomus tepperi]|uniref:zinc finger protein 830 n=1 Tax=Chironomus tepperi TaxID=113505 RepID=UPI00391F972F
MNAAFRLEKKKLSQHDLRRLMNEQKQSRTADANKIDSPFAKYDNGQLTCVLCKSIVRSESVWKVHINAKQHKDNLQLAKQLKEKLENQTKKTGNDDRIAGLKRSIEDMRSEVPEKKLKGILKNSTPSTPSATTNIVVKQNEVSNDKSQNDKIPDDFFDSKPKSKKSAKTKNEEVDSEKMQVDEALPEGFFDDPVKDAKARNLEYKDPVEEEWDKFQKEIKEAEVQSTNIINEEHEEATVERQIDEIDEQIRNWSRVLEMEKKKEEIETKLKQENIIKSDNDTIMKTSDTESDEDEDIPEFIDWRSKKSHK